MLDGIPEQVPTGLATDDEHAYHDGYARTIRELDWARRHGWVPTERQIVLGISQAMRVYSAARGGKFISGRHPEWLHGRADALRAALRGEALDVDSDESRG